jgi:hypothetical protein
MPALDGVRASLFGNRINWTIQFPVMSTDTAQFQLEGTWEDIVRNHKELAGKRVRVTVFSDEEEQARLRKLVDEFFAEIEAEPPLTKPPRREGPGAEFADAVAEKLRKQGIKS